MCSVSQEPPTAQARRRLLLPVGTTGRPPAVRALTFPRVCLLSRAEGRSAAARCRSIRKAPWAAGNLYRSSRLLLHRARRPSHPAPRAQLEERGSLADSVLPAACAARPAPTLLLLMAHPHIPKAWPHRSVRDTVLDNRAHTANSPSTRVIRPARLALHSVSA